MAVKRFECATINERLQRDLENEGYIMSILNHPSVCQFHRIVTEPGFYALVLKYYPGGSLFNLLHDEELELSWDDRAAMATQVARGMTYLHGKPYEPVIHGDLKTANILVDVDGSLVIADFGLSRCGRAHQHTEPGVVGQSPGHGRPCVCLNVPTSPSCLLVLPQCLLMLSLFLACCCLCCAGCRR